MRPQSSRCSEGTSPGQREVTSGDDPSRSCVRPGRTARAKGASERRVLTRHVLRNSMASTTTLLGLSLPTILAGALITEAVFNYPGMGYLFYQAAARQDYPVLLGFTVVVAVATVTGNLLADLGYAVLDPRVRYVDAT